MRGKDENPTQRPLAARPAHGEVDSGQAQHHRLGRFRLTRLGLGLSEQRSVPGELSSPSSIGEHSVVTQPRIRVRITTGSTKNQGLEVGHDL